MSQSKGARRLKKKIALLKVAVRKARRLYQVQDGIACALEREKSFSETLVRHMPTAIALLDQNFRIRVINPAHLRILGKEHASETIGKAYFDLTPLLERRLRPACEAVLASGRPQVVRGFKMDQFYWDLIQVPVFGNRETVEGVLLLANDVTDRIQRERLQQLQVKQLREADIMKEEILSVISHELRTPLNFITGFASLLEDGVAGKLPPLQLEYISHILKGADRMTRLIEDLLLMSQLAAGKIEVFPLPVSLEALALEIKASLKASFEEKQCELRLEIAPLLPPVIADPRYLQRILYNLVDNALKFSPSRSQVLFRVETRGGDFQIEVIDEGMGIPADQHHRIFERFYQVDMSSTRLSGGIGMGLAIAKSMAEVMGGQIGVESSPGEGARFWLSLPRKSQRNLKTMIAGPSQP